MNKAIIIYQSKKGTTMQFAYKIEDYLNNKGIQSEIISVEDFHDININNYDYIFLGCWTKGLMFFAQHPDYQWRKIVKSLSLSANAKIAMFTTYKILTGSMFSKMIECIPQNCRKNVLQIKSKNSSIPAKAIAQLENFTQ